MEFNQISNYQLDFICDDVLTPKDIQKILKIQRNKCYEMLRCGILPSFKLGKEYRILKTELLNFIQENHQ